MSNYAIVKNGIVANVIVWDGNKDVEAGGWQPPNDAQAIQIQANAFVCIGYSYSGGEFSPSPSPTSAD